MLAFSPPSVLPLVLCFLRLFILFYFFCFSVYSGHQSILVPPLELESNASLWLTAVSQYKVRVSFCSYSVMEMCTKGLGSQTEALRVSLSSRWQKFALFSTNLCTLGGPHATFRNCWYVAACIFNMNESCTQFLSAKLLWNSSLLMNFV